MKVLLLAQTRVDFEDWKVRHGSTWDVCDWVDPYDPVRTSTELGGRFSGGKVTPANQPLGDTWSLVCHPYWSDCLARAVWSDARAWASIEFGVDI